MAYSKSAVRESLEAQLRAKGADVTHFQSLIEDYLFYWDHEKKMQKSVKSDGIMMDAISAQGKPYKKENPAVKAAVMYNKQKLAILKELDLTTDAALGAEDDEL